MSEHMTALQFELFENGRPSKAALAHILDHPRHDEAIRIMAEGTVRLFKGNRLANAIVTDRGRFLMTVFAVHLHHTRRPGDPRSGLTLARLRELVSTQNICSPGRVVAMTTLMRVFGYLTPTPEPEDRRLRLLAPSDELMRWHRERALFTLRCADAVLPGIAPAIEALEDPRFLPAYLSELAEVYLTGFYYVDFVPEMKAFLDFNAGVATLFALYLAGDADDTIPPARPIRVSISSIARSFSISRVHVRRLLKRAADDGMIRRTGDERYVILPRLTSALSRNAALYLAHNVHSAQVALKGLDRARAAA